MPTASLTAVVDELAKRKGRHGNGGNVACRPKRVGGVLRPDLGYSEHAFGNADDWMVNGAAAQKPFVDELARMKSQGYPVGLVLHAGVRADHTDHIHIEGAPSLSHGQKPPCAGGAAVTMNTNPNVPDRATLESWQASEAAEIAAEGTGLFTPISIPIIGDIPLSLGHFVFVLVAAGAIVALIVFLVSGFLKSDIGKAATAVATKGVV